MQYAWQIEVFEHVYRCFSVSSLGRPNLENGDKIIMPSSALDSLVRLEIEYPMLFELNNPSAERTTHCGVLEFTADEGIAYLPNWMMEDMLIEEGGIVSLKSTSLVKGKFVKFQPHSKEFLDITNPKVMLEKSLRSYSCLTTGRTIMIPYNDKKYYIDVVETKPTPAISIIETDCEVDFAPPLDYKEPEKPLPSDLSDKEPPQVEEETATKTPAVIPFSGFGRRLGGKPSTQSVEQTSTPILKQQQTENTMSSNRTSGKLVFGSKANAPNVQTQPKASPKSTSQDSSSKKTDTPQFQAFSGKKYSLRD
ncbi:ubiquitin recognition factor in ER-associated degradation protein 1-like [Trifolium pratense]|uniref:ubiquitin recognition factor in ER-associated degradation protein 1-like n=1 Tax=Trifolium pratense TaxID=57577 RepID=UPI001E6948B7|nr:ubiquitin recognition factor in ER-associated degradation protein 1-like [Trifolium pratense]